MAIQNIICILCCIAYMGVVSESVEIQVAPKIIISRLQSEPRANIANGIVPGTKSCGGSGKLLQWRYETCQESDNPCQAPADGSLKTAQVDFIPSKDITSLGLRLTVHSNDGQVNKEYNFEGPIFNAGVKAGEGYTITNAGGVTEELKGKRATFQYILYDKLSNEVEICAESEFQYV